MTSLQNTLDTPIRGHGLHQLSNRRNILQPHLHFHIKKEKKKKKKREREKKRILFVFVCKGVEETKTRYLIMYSEHI